MKLSLIASSTIDYIDGNKRCGGSAVYSPIPLLALNASFVVYYVTCPNNEINFPFASKPIFADECFIFKHKYVTLNHRESSIQAMPSKPVKINIDAENFDAVVVNPLLGEFDLNSIQEVIEHVNLSVVDLQGFIRRVDKNGKIVFYMLENHMKKVLGKADVLIASSDEYKWEPFGKIFILTMGEKGARGYWNNKSVFVATIKVNTVPVGTGDMFASSFAYCFSKEKNVKNCLGFANAMVSTLLEYIEFNDKGCVNYDKIIHNRSEILAEFEERKKRIESSI